MILIYCFIFWLISIDEGIATNHTACDELNFISRKEWSARNPKQINLISTPVPRFFVHHTAMSECSNFEKCSKNMKSIQNFHMDDRGWDDIGYNFLMGGDGKIYEGRGWNREGAHTKGYNRDIAISLMGDFSKKRPSDLMVENLEKFIQCAVDKGILVKDYKLHGHRDGVCTECPGQALYDIIKKWDHFEGGPLEKYYCGGVMVTPTTPRSSSTTADGACDKMEFVSRKDWSAREPKEVNIIKTPVPRLFVHHTAGPLCENSEACLKEMKRIQNFHMDTRGWSDIGYSFLMGGDGRIYEGRGWNREGAHTKGYNRDGIAISLMGDFSKRRPSDLMVEKLKEFIQCAQEKGHVVQDFQLHGHRDAGPTECPGQFLYDIIKTWDHFKKGPLNK